MLNFVFHLCDLKCMWPQTAHKWKFSKYILPSDFDFSVSSFSNTNKHWVLISVERPCWTLPMKATSRYAKQALPFVSPSLGIWFWLMDFLWRLYISDIVKLHWLHWRITKSKLDQAFCEAKLLSFKTLLRWIFDIVYIIISTHINISPFQRYFFPYGIVS